MVRTLSASVGQSYNDFTKYINTSEIMRTIGRSRCNYKNIFNRDASQRALIYSETDIADVPAPNLAQKSTRGSTVT